MLWLDAFRPADRVLAANVPDARATHFWDPGKSLSKEIRRSSWMKKIVGAPPGAVWDWVALYPSGVRWKDDVPKPDLQGFPVVDAADEVNDWLGHAN